MTILHTEVHFIANLDFDQCLATRKMNYDSVTHAVVAFQTTGAQCSFYSQLDYVRTSGNSKKLSALKQWAKDVEIPTSDSHPNHPDVIASISR